MTPSHKINFGLNTSSKALLALLLHIVAITTILFFAKPIYRLTEDFYAAYLLGNGFATGNTSLLHYNHVLHPVITAPVYWLFSVNNAINWYSVLLVCAHGLASSLLFYCVLTKTRNWIFIAAYWVLFLVFEADALLHINFNNTSLVMYTAAVVWLFTHFTGQHSLKKHGFILVMLFSMASLFRMHTGLIVLGVSLPFFVMLVKGKRRNATLTVFLLGALMISALHYWHEAYYEQQIKGWKQEEFRRQQVYQLYNTDLGQNMEDPGATWYIPYHMARKGLLVDTVLLHAANLNKMLQYLKHTNNAGFRERWKFRLSNKPANSWFWINNRLFMVTALLFFVILPLNRQRMIITAASLLLLVGGIIFLLLYARLMDYVLIHGLHTILLLVLIATAGEPVFSRFKKIAIYTAFFLLTVWSLVHVGRTGKRNEERIQQFKTFYSKLAVAPDTLFVITSYDFPLQHFYIWDVPQNYRLKNFISNEHFLLQIHEPVLKRFGINNFSELVFHDNVLFCGNETNYLQRYFQTVTNRTISVSKQINTSNVGVEISKIIAVTE